MLADSPQTMVMPVPPSPPSALWHSIAAIHNAHVPPDWDTVDSSIAQRGFLIQSVTPPQLEAAAAQGTQYWILVPTAQAAAASEPCPTDDILAFLSLRPALMSPRAISSLAWLDSAARAVAHDPRHWHIQVVATAPHLTHSGYGRILYRELLTQFPNSEGDCFFSTLVVTHPFPNHASLAFHHRLGFQTLATLQRDSFLHWTDYQAAFLGWQWPV